MKHNKLNQWLWKWHFIGGLIVLPFVILLAITGGIYLFKDDYEAPRQKHIRYVEAKGNTIAFQKQLELAKTVFKKQPNAMVVPTAPNQATEFVSGRFSHKKSVFINPYTAQVSGKISPKDSNMHTVRKLHGELLLGSFGTKIIELVASWLFVLIITGIYVFWPKEQGIKAFFRIRLKQGKRLFFRDLHSVLGFWVSLLLVITLAGGMPWTDVFGSSFKWVQKVTHTGFPKTWSGRGLASQVGDSAVTLDAMVALAQAKNLKGTVSVGLPMGPKGVYSIYNETFDLETQERFYYDQYSGKQVFKHEWQDVGILMRGRMWVMAFHQGQFGLWNWILMLSVAIIVTVVALAGLLSYLKRKQKGDWGVPKVPAQFKVGYGIIAGIIVLGIVFPLFGLSVLLIAGIDYFKRLRQQKMEV
jgi:uncharacterized iron-regulated membrane protein